VGEKTFWCFFVNVGGDFIVFIKEKGEILN